MSLRTLGLSLALAACTPGPAPGESDSDATGTTASAQTGPATTSGSSAAPTTTSGGSTAEGSTGANGTGVAFIRPHDIGVDTTECDLWRENCPDGQKCMPYSGDGDNAWESLKCVPVVPDPDGVGEPCTVLGSPVSGLDTCDEHAMCWDVDPRTGTGTCVAMCIGSPDAPACADPHADCHLSNGDVLVLCLPQCDPIAQDCPGDDPCIANPQDPHRFLCILDTQIRLGVFKPCEYLSDCEQGLMCVESALAVECDPMAFGCCLPFCDTDDPNTCPGQGQQCVPWYDDPADAAPHNIDVGLCQLPTP